MSSRDPSCRAPPHAGTGLELAPPGARVGPERERNQGKISVSFVDSGSTDFGAVSGVILRLFSVTKRYLKSDPIFNRT